MKEVWERFKDGFAPLGSDRNFANLIIFVGILIAGIELLVYSLVAYTYFYVPEVFPNCVRAMKTSWLEEVAMAVTAGILIWFGIHIKKGLK